jgi:AcrR family transcriptional regulator
MNGRFFDLRKDKQDRMMNGAMKVFAAQGYRHASTDTIVKEAGISKGLLFHYFESKLGVYSFVYEYSVRFLTLELRGAVDPKERDLFELMKQVEQAKTHAMRGYPYILQFINRSMAEDVSEALLAIEDMRNQLTTSYETIYMQADLSGLPPSVDSTKIQKMLELTIKGLLNERILEASLQPEILYHDIADYIDMVKSLVVTSKEIR